MKKSYRVKNEKEFQQVFKKGQSFANRKFIVYILEKPNQVHFRVGISVGKKIGNAVTRNKVKRKLRQSFLELKLEIKKDCDFIVIARPGAELLSMNEVKKNFVHVAKLAKLL